MRAPESVNGVRNILLISQYPDSRDSSTGGYAMKDGLLTVIVGMMIFGALILNIVVIFLRECK